MQQASSIANCANLCVLLGRCCCKEGVFEGALDGVVRWVCIYF